MLWSRSFSVGSRQEEGQSYKNLSQELSWQQVSGVQPCSPQHPGSKGLFLAFQELVPRVTEVFCNTSVP